jgi:hypothetical protein
MRPNDIKSLKEIISHNVQQVHQRDSLVDTLIDFIDHISSNPARHIPTEETILEPPVKRVISENKENKEEVMHVIPKVLCRLKREIGYGIANQDKDD